MIPDAVADALQAAGLHQRPVRASARGLSAHGWFVDEPPIAYVKWRPDQPQRIRPEVAALRHLEASEFSHTPRVLAVSECGTAFVASYIDGQPLDSVRDPAAARDLGRMVARLHRLDVGPAMKRSTDPMAIGDRVLHTATRDSARRTGSLDEALHWLTENRPGRLRDDRFIHRDLRPENVIADGRGLPIGLVDFERACVGDPAWDWVKLGWWCVGPQTWDAFRAGYATIVPPPEESTVRWFAMAEAIGLSARFEGNYRLQADRQIRALLADAPPPSWIGGSTDAPHEDAPSA